MSDAKQEHVSAHVSLRLRIPIERFEGVDLTADHEEDDSAYFRAAEFVAENLADLMEYADMVEKNDVEVDF